jgi:hypothetical protein
MAPIISTNPLLRRDMTAQQFNTACKRHGFESQGFLGYYSVGVFGVHVSVHNAGPTRREQLAYLIQQRKLASKREAESRKG